jgi:hypothetical protein
MTTDLDTRLADLRRSPHWSAAERAAVLDAVLGTDPVPRRADLRLMHARTSRGRRTTMVASTAGLAAAAAIALPAVLPAGSPGSADRAAAVSALHHLAHVAAVSPADQLGPKQYLHLVEVDRQNALAGQPAVASRYEDWIRADGLTWQLRRERLGTGPVREEVWRLPPGPQFIDGMPARQSLDGLPTEPAALEAYVRAHSVGSTSSDERVYVAVADIVRRGLAKPELRSAAIEVLARLGHVRLGDEKHDSLGNPVQAFDFVDPKGRPDETRTILFDTRTAQITEEREYFHGKLHFHRTVPVFDVVDSVPADIRKDAIVQK